MADRFNTIAGWTLFSGIVALGCSSLSGHYFKAGKEDRPSKMGYKIAGVVEETAGGAAEIPIENLLATADPKKGEAVFAKCMGCHTINQGGANGNGPNLYGVLGDAIGHGRGGYAFSEALKAKSGKWDWAGMNAWLTSPSAFANGTKMGFAGIEEPQDRANLIVYLNSQGSNLPLPKPKAGPAAGAAPGERAVEAGGKEPASTAR